MTELHARIQSYLQQQTVPPLHSVTPQADHFYNKAGTVPYISGSQKRFLVMKPVAKHAHLPPPQYQLCKGTRMHKLETGWHDLADGQLPTGTPETLLATALREGVEELGLIPEAIKALYDVGPYAFASAKSQTPRYMWLFASELPLETALLPMLEVAGTTAERRWMTLEEFAQEGRDDHIAILSDIATKLEAL